MVMLLTKTNKWYINAVFIFAYLTKLNLKFMTQSKFLIRLFLSIACTCVYSIISAQKSQIDFRYGHAFPTGSFSDKDINKSNTGLALKGTFKSIHLTQSVSERAGLVFGYLTSSNPIDKDVLLQDIKNSYPAYLSFSINTDEWITRMIAGGIQLKSNVSQSIQIKSRLLVGYAYGESVYYDYTVFDFLGFLGKYESQSTKGSSIGYQIGMSFEYLIHKNMQLGINSEFFATNIAYERHAIVVSRGNSYTTSNEYGIPILNFLIGVNYNIRF